MSDQFYDYQTFSNERLHNIMTAWDGLSGYHGLLIKEIASHIPHYSSVLDVGCGLCHLYEAIKDHVRLYVGVDKDSRVIKWARERYASDPIVILEANVYDLQILPLFDVVTAVGLYSGQPVKADGVLEMLDHARYTLLITYFHKEKYIIPDFFHPHYAEIIPHTIDDRLTILKVTKNR